MKNDTLMQLAVTKKPCKPYGVGAFLLSGLLAAGMAWANPIDPVSNPERLSFPDIRMKMSDYDEPFQRDGVLTKPEIFQQIKQGMNANQVVALIGQPLNANTQSQDKQWDYNFKFLMPVSDNHIVCQYKVVFDQNQLLENGYWRRHQCLDIVNGVAKTN